MTPKAAKGEREAPRSVLVHCYTFGDALVTLVRKKQTDKKLKFEDILASVPITVRNWRRIVANEVTPGTGTFNDLSRELCGKEDRDLFQALYLKATQDKKRFGASDIAGLIKMGSGVDCTTATNRCGADLLEPRSRLAQRHAECTDCHNPHRVIRNRLFNANPAVPDAAGTHRHEEAAGSVHSNLASGVLRGTWGVEPVYGSSSFQALPSGYTVKRGDPGANTDTSVVASFVTREYQICLKCHSDYAYPDNNVHPAGNRPLLGRLGGTTAGTNGLTVYTNQAREFQAPVTHQGEGTKPNSGAGSNYATNNHRSWHPVIGPTGRSGMNAAALRLPWSNAIGTQTMYCSDCHGDNTPEGTVVPAGGDNGTLDRDGLARAGGSRSCSSQVGTFGPIGLSTPAEQ